MPDLKISQLTPAVSLTGTEILPLAISGTNESATTAQVAGLAASSLTDTYIPFSDNGVFADSYLVNDTDILKTVYSGNDIGLLIDYANTKYRLGANDDRGFVADGNYVFTMGDPNLQGNYGTTLIVDDNNGVIKTTFNGSDFGFLLDFGNNVYKFGDFDGVTDSVSLIVDNTQQIITTTSNLGTGGLTLNFLLDTYSFGGQSVLLNIVNNNSVSIYNGIQGQDDGILCDFNTEFCIFGNTGRSFISFDQQGSEVKLELGNNTLLFNNITTAATAGALSGYIEIVINGTTRKIPYYAV